MKKHLIWLFLFLSSLSFGQTLTAVTATITDPTGQIFANGKVSVVYISPPNAQAPPRSNGVLIATQANGLLDGTGTFTISLADLSVVSPTGGAWQFSICPNVTSGCQQINSKLVIGATVNLSTQLSAQITTIIVGPNITLSSAYKDAELTTAPGVLWLDATINALKFADSLNVVHTLGAGGGGSGSVTSVSLGGTTNQITVTGASPVTTVGGWVVSLPSTLVVPGSLTVTGATAFLSLSGTAQCLQVDVSGNLGGTGGLCGSIIGSLTAGVIPQALDTTHIEDSNPVLDNGNTTANTLTYAGSGGFRAIKLGTGTPPTGCGSANGCWVAAEGATLGTPTSGQDYIRADSTTHQWLQSLNGGAEVPLGSGFLSGTLNTIVKFASTTTGGNSSLVDDGTNPVTSPHGVGLQTTGDLTIDKVNMSSPGTTLNKFVCKGSTAGTVVICPTSTKTGVQGVATTGIGTAPGVTGSTSVCITGTCQVIADGTTVIGDYGIPSTTVAGDIHDTGSTTPTAAVDNFLITSVATVGNSATIELTTPDWYASQAAAKVYALQVNGTGLTAGDTVNLNGTTPAGAGITVQTSKTGTTDSISFALNTQYKLLHMQAGGLGDGLNVITAGTYPLFLYSNDSAVTWTISAISCYTDNSGSSTMDASNNAGTSYLNAPVTCTNVKSTRGAPATLSATFTIPANDGITFTFVSDGASKSWTPFILATQ